MSAGYILHKTSPREVARPPRVCRKPGRPKTGWRSWRSTWRVRPRISSRKLQVAMQPGGEAKQAPVVLAVRNLRGDCDRLLIGSALSGLVESSRSANDHSRLEDSGPRVLPA